MTFRSQAAALEAYRAGQADDGLRIAGEIVATNPHAADAYLAQVLIQLRKGDLSATAEALKKLAKLRSADWILQALRADFARGGVPPITKDMALRLGGFLRGALPLLGPALQPAQRRAKHAFVNVLGSSWIRSFGGNPAFFPLFIGMGPTTLLLTDETAAVTRRKLDENLRRCDTTRDTLLMFGSDAHYQAINFLAARGSADRPVTAEDLAAMDACAQRHRPMLEDARKLVTGRLFLVGSTPMREDLTVKLAQRLNIGLRKVCEETGVEFLDWWSVLADPETQQLKSNLGADAYPNDAHFRIEATELFIDLLKAERVFSPEVPSTSSYDWTHVFECEVNKSERTRIWCEPAISPNNAVKSHKIAASHLGQRVAEIVTLFAAIRPDPLIAMINVRDAYLPIMVPAAAHAGCLAASSNPRDVEAGQMVLDFYGRSDVTLRLHGPDFWADFDGQGFDLVVMEISPKDVEGDSVRCQEALARMGAVGAVLIATCQPARITELELKGRRIVAQMDLPNRHIPTVWHNYALVIVR